MTASRTDNPSVLFWDVSQLGDDDFIARLVKFPEWGDSVNLVPPFTYDLPTEVQFEANFRTLNNIDYPYTDVRWPIMSERMRDLLSRAGDFPHQLIPVTMIDDRVPSKNRRRKDGALKPEATRKDFAAVKLLEPLDVFDWDRSQYDRDPEFPKFASNVRKWVLKRPNRGFPPLFRVSADSTLLFVSTPARDALERGGVKGIEFQKLVEVVA